MSLLNSLAQSVVSSQRNTAIESLGKSIGSSLETNTVQNINSKSNANNEKNTIIGFGVFGCVAFIVVGIVLIKFQYINGRKKADNALNQNEKLNKELDSLRQRRNEQIIVSSETKGAKSSKVLPEFKNKKLYDELNDQVIKIGKQIEANNFIIKVKPGAFTIIGAMFFIFVGIVVGYLTYDYRNKPTRF